jgi:hypothetical protein
MKKLLAIVLVVIAVPLYIWDVSLLLEGVFRTGKHRAGTVATGTTLKAVPGLETVLHFTQKGRSPFVPYKEIPKPAVKVNDTKKIQPAPSVVNAAPPPVSINGIMWNENNPVAIINLPDGSSTVAKKGQVLTGGIVIKNIEKNQVEVEYNGKRFWLKK